MRYSKGFKKVIYGCIIIEAENEVEAQRKFDEGDIEEEFDNKSDYEYNDDFEEMGN